MEELTWTSTSPGHRSVTADELDWQGPSHRHSEESTVSITKSPPRWHFHLENDLALRRFALQHSEIWHRVNAREDRARIPALHSHVIRVNGARTKQIWTYGANPAWQREGDFWGDDQEPLVRRVPTQLYESWLSEGRQQGRAKKNQSLLIHVKRHQCTH